MQTNSPELETKSANKDLWLFLIVLDVIFLCVFGFFLYKYFAAQVLNPSASAPAPVVEEPAQPADPLPEIAEEVVTVTEDNVVTPAPAVKEEVIVPQVVVPAAPAEVAVAEKQTPAKQSIVVAPAVANSKYRRVTFKWFEPAETVAIVSGFTNRKAQALKKVGDHWETTLSIAPGTYKFLYVVDGKNTRDPYAEEKDGRSVVVIK